MEPLTSLLAMCGTRWNGRYTCRLPACPTCRRRYVRLEQRLNVQRFATAPPDELAHVTIALGATRDVESIDLIIAKALRDLRNRIHACRRRDLLWDDLSIGGWWVVEATAAKNGSPIWLISTEMIVSLCAVQIENLKQALRRQWPQPRHVVVRRVTSLWPVERTVAGIVQHANSHACRHLGHDGALLPWPGEWTEALYGHIATKRNAFEFFRFNIRPAERPRRSPPQDLNGRDSHGAMPVVV